MKTAILTQNLERAIINIKAMIRILLLVLCYCSSFAQNHQTLRGTVTDAVNSNPIPSAGISLFGKDTFNLLSDIDGKFEINIPFGVYRLVITHLNYERLELNEVQINSSRQTIRDLHLIPRPVQLKELNIESVSLKPLRLENEEIEKFPAAYNDPARMASYFPGVIQADDQANHISIRGLSPAFLQWQINGADILNPNHLENAGTFSDNASASGGGVNMINAQILSHTDLYSGVKPTVHNSIAGGNLDMHFRDADNMKFENSVLLSLLGTGITTEGPVIKNKSSFLASYRYSTVGLLDKLGVSFGDEHITYEDFSFLYAHKIGKSRIRFFTIAGNSSNIHEPVNDTIIDVIKDLLDIRYKSLTLLSGFQFLTEVRNAKVNARINWSQKSTQRSQSWALAPEFDQRINLEPKLLSGLVTVDHRVGSRFFMQEGIKTNWYTRYSNGNLNNKAFNSSAKIISNQVFVQGRYYLNDRFTLSGGGNLGINSSNETRIEPAFNGGLNFIINSSNQVEVYSAKRYQLLPWIVALNQNKFLNTARSHEAGINHLFAISGTTVKNAVYYQKFNDIPQFYTGGYRINSMNLLEEMVVDSVNPLNGKGKSYGYELTITQTFFKSYHTMLSGTLFRSEFSDESGYWQASRFDNRYAVNMVIGREKVSRRNERRTYGVNIHIIYRGGLNQSRINESRSESEFQTIYKTGNYPIQLDEYFRTDLRLTIRTQYRRATGTFYLDIQNISNHANQTGYYYEHITKSVLPKYQLGIIPVLGYEFDF